MTRSTLSCWGYLNSYCSRGEAELVAAGLRSNLQLDRRICTGVRWQLHGNPECSFAGVGLRLNPEVWIQRAQWIGAARHAVDLIGRLGCEGDSHGIRSPTLLRERVKLPARLNLCFQGDVDD